MPNNSVYAAKGALHPLAKLTGAQIAEILARVAAGEMQKDLAVEYGVSQPHISRIVRGHRRAQG